VFLFVFFFPQTKSEKKKKKKKKAIAANFVEKLAKKLSNGGTGKVSHHNDVLSYFSGARVGARIRCFVRFFFKVR
jgi:hypothetical protein